MARDRASGPLSILATSSTSPASFMRTITDRRRCRSIPTYCGCCCTGVLLRLEGLGWEAPSVPALGPLRRSEAPLFAAITPPPTPRRSPSPRIPRTTPAHPQPPAKHIAVRTAALQQTLPEPRALINHQGRRRFQLLTPHSHRRRPAPPGPVTQKRRSA